MTMVVSLPLLLTMVHCGKPWLMTMVMRLPLLQTMVDHSYHGYQVWFTAVNHGHGNCGQGLKLSHCPSYELSIVSNYHNYG